ncbi:hypothetical protein [Pseudomonas sp. B21-053]|uniref:hypothetical protein n=1 Tax=Pseudomonas sp. B21-053 TaxID=2895493 RepID=UPI0022304891|nr:hypothetical protein [Pseudomonas sp. B21-053]UZE12929.1 hypothetical protein LOY68_04790 [Pseudomonas sp. B21-053]
MSIDNASSEYYLTFGRKGQEALTAVDPGFMNGLNGLMIAGSVGGSNRAGVAFGFPRQDEDGKEKIINYAPATWEQMRWQFTEPDGQFFEVQSGHLVIKLENKMTLITGSLYFKLQDESEVEGTFRLLKR